MSAQALPIIGFWRAPRPTVANTFPPLSKSIAAAFTPAFAGTPERSRDRELLGRVAKGDVTALRVLYDEHASRALAIARRILRNAEEAEDVVQETFLELWRRAHQFDGKRGGAVAWVVTIARSRAIDRLRASATAGRAVEGASTSPDVHPVIPVEFPRRQIGPPTAMPNRSPNRDWPSRFSILRRILNKAKIFW